MECYNVVVLCFIDAIITKDKQRILLHTSVALCKNIDDNDKTILSDYIENTCPWNVKRYPEVVALKQKPTKYSPMIISTSNYNWFLLIRQWKIIIRFRIFIHQYWDTGNTNRITGQIILQLFFANQCLCFQKTFFLLRIE